MKNHYKLYLEGILLMEDLDKTLSELNEKGFFTTNFIEILYEAIENNQSAPIYPRHVKDNLRDTIKYLYKNKHIPLEMYTKYFGIINDSSEITMKQLHDSSLEIRYSSITGKIIKRALDYLNFSDEEYRNMLLEQAIYDSNNYYLLASKEGSLFINEDILKYTSSIRKIVSLFPEDLSDELFHNKIMDSLYYCLNIKELRKGGLHYFVSKAEVKSIMKIINQHKKTLIKEKVKK